jgi:hypothetical protein
MQQNLAKHEFKGRKYALLNAFKEMSAVLLGNLNSSTGM